MFDLPTKTKLERQAYTVFRKDLMKDGFMQLQYSVYARHSASEENALVHINRAKSGIPAKGEVRIVLLTDKQYGRMMVFYGNFRKKTEKAPNQLEFF
jgi:CRISPR-associated protein Cas2